ncbi:MAG: hypothetical protein NVS1B16_11330 [Pseudarthrobacter sp.]
MRAGLSAFLQPPAVTGLTAVYPSLPVLTPGTAFFATPGQSSGATGFVFIEREQEQRLSMPAQTGWKRVVYNVLVVINYFYVGVGTPGGGVADAGEPGILAINGYDTIVDSLKARIRSDLTCGGTFFSGGNGAELGGADLELASDLPVFLDPEIGIRGALRLTGAELIQA